MSALDVMMNFSGLFVGPLLKEFSYRKVAIFGSLLCGLGLALTSPASSVAHIIATYSVINGEWFFLLFFGSRVTRQRKTSLRGSPYFIIRNNFFKSKTNLINRQ